MLQRLDIVITVPKPFAHCTSAFLWEALRNHLELARAAWTSGCRLRAFISQLEDLHLGVGATQSARPSLVLYSRWAFKKEL